MKKISKTNLRTRKLIAALEKTWRKKRQAIWIDLAERLSKPRRKIIEVNIWKLEKLRKRFGEKIFVVPGKVLGFGNLNGSISVVALSFSKNAIEKINQKKGKHFLFEELLELNVKPSNLMIVA
jgi:large subunit ribosomal protein L18e